MIGSIILLLWGIWCIVGSYYVQRMQEHITHRRTIDGLDGTDITQ